jgi:hypothetical protein
VLAHYRHTQRESAEGGKPSAPLFLPFLTGFLVAGAVGLEPTTYGFGVINHKKHPKLKKF